MSALVSSRSLILFVLAGTPLDGVLQRGRILIDSIRELCSDASHDRAGARSQRRGQRSLAAGGYGAGKEERPMRHPRTRGVLASPLFPPRRPK